VIADLAAGQHGVVSVWQLRDLGLDRHWVWRRVQSGFLHPVFRGVYSVRVRTVSRRGRYLAVVFACGPNARLSHRCAADLWRLRPNSTHLEVTTAAKRAGPPRVQVHRSRSLAPHDTTILDGIPVTSVARTLLDLSAVVPARDLEVAIDRAERLEIFDLTAIQDVLARARGKKGARALREAIAAYEPSMQKSVLERRFKELLETRPDIPRPSFNALIDGESGTHEVDAYWERERLAIQVDGFEFHRTRRARERDAASDADLELAGLKVMRLTWDDVTVQGLRTLRRVRLALHT
jgi:hypothetical protein